MRVLAGTHALATRVPDFLPPGVDVDPIERPRTEFVLHAVSGCSCDDAHEGRGWVAGGLSSTAAQDDDAALLALRAGLKMWIAANAVDHVFVHAGVVGWNDEAVVLPGPTHGGKTTLVAALLAAGATYYSDDMAVIDTDGRVHPYPLPLGIRTEGSATQRHVEAAAWGAASGDRRLPIGLMLATQYRPDARWAPEPMSRRATVATLLGNSVGARAQPERTLDVLLRATPRANGWRTPRSDTRAAVEFVAEHLGDVDRSSPCDPRSG